MTSWRAGVRVGNVEKIGAPGYLRQGGVPVGLSGTFSVFRRKSDGEWQAFDTGLSIPTSYGRMLFLDVNGDGLPDAWTGDVRIASVPREPNRLIVIT